MALGGAASLAAANVASDAAGTATAWASAVEACSNSFVMIIVTELGDKTFFIAALLAMRYSRRAVFAGAWGALAIMTVLSAAIGQVLPMVLPRKYTHWAAVALFIYFGVKLLYEGLQMVTSGEGAGPSGELEEVETSLKDVDSKGAREVAFKALMLTFVAEWGDRSQIATIALAAAKDPLGVTLGGVFGHCLCTGLAVLGGRMLAAHISERAVALCGGLLFLVFAAHGVGYGPDA